MKTWHWIRCLIGKRHEPTAPEYNRQIEEDRQQEIEESWRRQNERQHDIDEGWERVRRLQYEIDAIRRRQRHP